MNYPQLLQHLLYPPCSLCSWKPCSLCLMLGVLPSLFKNSNSSMEILLTLCRKVLLNSLLSWGRHTLLWSHNSFPIHNSVFQSFPNYASAGELILPDTAGRHHQAHITPSTNVYYVFSLTSNCTCVCVITESESVGNGTAREPSSHTPLHPHILLLREMMCWSHTANS